MTNKISKIFGIFANCAFPSFLQKIINQIYVRIFRINLSEFEDISHYKTLNELFTRELKMKRVFNKNSDVMIAPTDSLVTQIGRVQHNQALQIKGMEYNATELLGEKSLDSTYFFVNFYLSPSDYHHYHAPCDMDIFEVRYFGGELLAVNPPSLKKNKNLFVRNERVVVRARDKNQNELYFVAIGALNVGKMSLTFESRIQTNAIPNQKCNFCYAQPIKIEKGEELGMFMMGSTIVLFAKNLESSLEIWQKVRFGDEIGIF